MAMSLPSLHRESTESVIHISHLHILYIHVYVHVHASCVIWYTYAYSQGFMVLVRVKYPMYYCTWYPN